jgi:hypothetical protein
MTRYTKTLFAALTSWLVACGGASMPPSTMPSITSNLEGSCDLRASESQCQDITGIPTEQELEGVAEKCAAVSHGTWSASLCPHTGALGGCHGPLGDGAPESVQQTTWYYFGGAGGLLHTRADAKAVCGTTFVAP